MKLLILHRIPYHKIEYHRGIDHNLHEVVYVGTESALENIPKDLRCQKLKRPGNSSASSEIINLHLQKSFGEKPFDLVISLSEYELLEAAKIREALNIKGPTLDKVNLVRDKVAMKNAILKSGIRAPLYSLIRPLLVNLENRPWQGPTVLKPKDGASSENIFIFSSLENCLESIKNNDIAVNNFNLDNFQVEEFIEGEILHIDGLVSKNEIQIWLPSQYLGNCLNYANGKALGSVQIEPTMELFEFTRSSLNAVQISEGSFHLEVIKSASGLVFLEVANRVGGADVVDTFERATGIFLPAAELSSLVGDSHIYSIETQARKVPEHFGWFVIPGHHLEKGFVCIEGFEAYRNDKHLIRYNELKEKELPSQITYQAIDVPLAGIVCAPNLSELKIWLTEFLRNIKVSSRPNYIKN